MKNIIVEKDLKIKMIFADNVNQSLEINDYEITFSMVTESAADEVNRAQIEHNINFAKVNTLLDIINYSTVVAYDTLDATTLSFLGKFQNNIMVLPDVSEMSMMATLHKKMNTLCSRFSFVESIKMKDLTQNIRYEYINTDCTYEELPTKDEWVSDLSYWDTPWWDREDVSTYDKEADDEDELEVWQIALEEQDVSTINKEVLTMIEEEVLSVMENIENGTPVGELVEVDFAGKDKKWKPTIV